MTPAELDRAYFALCQAMRDRDELETTRFLSRFGLLLLSRTADLGLALEVIEDAKNVG